MCILTTYYSSLMFTIPQRLDKDWYNYGVRKRQDGQRQCVLVLHRDTGTGFPNPRQLLQCRRSAVNFGNWLFCYHMSKRPAACG